jgi:PBP1b-binding outer membrane lipoprotein LpoB
MKGRNNMKILYFITIIIYLFLLSSCSKENNPVNSNNTDNTNKPIAGFNYGGTLFIPSVINFKNI